MSIPLVVGDVLEIRVMTYHTSTFQVGENVLTYSIEDLGGAANVDDQDLFDTTEGFFAATYPPCLHNQARFSGTENRRIFPGFASVPYKTTAGNGPGTGGATAVPDQMAALIKKSSLVAGRVGRGRAFLPFLPAAFLVAGSGQLNLATSGALLTIAGQIALLVGSTALGVGFTLRGMIPHRAGLGSSVPISTASLSTRLAAQHRRGNYGKLNAEFTA